MQNWKSVGLISTTTGCPFRCNFCACWKLTKGKSFFRDPKKVAEELKQIKEQYIYFADDNSFLNLRAAYQLYELIKEAGIKKRYFGYIRADTIANNEDLIKKWSEIGLDSLVVGIETFNSEDINKFNKSSTVEINREAIRILQKYDIINYAHIILKPDFTKEDFDKLHDEVVREGIIRPVFPLYTPLPGTDLFEEKKDELISLNYDLYDLGHMVLRTKLPLKQYIKVK